MVANKRTWNPKRVASVILWIILFGGIVVDSNDKLQSAFRLVPPRFSRYIPILYGIFALAALILLHFAHADELASVSEKKIDGLSRAQRAALLNVLRRHE